jgi:ABC-type branched-subunit amino acid transport system substrate-binding protein
VYKRQLASNVGVKALFECAAAQRQFYLGHIDTAAVRLSDFLKRGLFEPPDSTRIKSLLLLSTHLKNKSTKKLRIGVLLPFQLKPFDNSTDIGSASLMLGVHFGAGEANHRLPNGAALLSYRNTAHRSPEEIISLAKSLIDEDSVQVVLGPMFSAEAVAVSHYCASRQIPMITPTATDEGITKVSPISFQLNPTHFARGAAMARFAFEDLNARTVGVFVQDSTYSKEMGEGFKAEIERQGGLVKIFGVLPPKFSSFSKVIVPLNLRFDEETGYPQTRLDAIYLPLTSPDAVAIAISQLRFYNISGELLGSSDWLDKRLLSNRQLLTSFYYASDFYISDNSSTSAVQSSFKLRFGESPSSLFWLGFDAISYLSAVCFEKSSSSSLANIIKTSPRIELHHSPIDFSGGNINRAMSIIRFTNGAMARVK